MPRRGILKRGDRVVCVYSRGYTDMGLDTGRSYEVEHVDAAGDVLLHGLDYFFPPHPFVLASQPDVLALSAGVDRYGWVR